MIKIDTESIPNPPEWVNEFISSVDYTDDDGDDDGVSIVAQEALYSLEGALSNLAESTAFLDPED